MITATSCFLVLLQPKEPKPPGSLKHRARNDGSILCCLRNSLRSNILAKSGILPTFSSVISDTPDPNDLSEY